MSEYGKSVKVVITGNAQEEYERLNEVVGKEVTSGIRKSDHQKLFKSLKQKIELLKDNPEHGIHISKKKIPKEYVADYEINNLWKIDLTKYWPLLYTIRGSEVEIIALILDILDHKKYDKKFGYRKK